MAELTFFQNHTVRFDLYMGERKYAEGEVERV